MRLLTYQHAELEPHSGAIDPERSTFLETLPHYRHARDQLVRLLGTDQFVWCLEDDEARRGGWRRHWRDRAEWEMCIEASDILALVDSDVWHIMIGKRTPAETRATTLRDAGLIRDLPPEHAHWSDHVLLRGDAPPGRAVHILIRFPIPTSIAVGVLPPPLTRQ